MAGGTYTISIQVDPSGAVTGMQTVRGELGQVQAAAKETGSVFAGMFKFFAVSEALSELYKLADAFLSIESNVKVASQAQGDLNQQTDALGQVALDTRGNFEALSTLYRNLGVNAESLGLSQKDLLSITKTVSESFAVGGATSQEMKNGIIQLGHAFEQSKVQGQTLNAIVRDAPQLMLNVAKAAGTNITGLKEMAKAGELSGKTLAQLTIQAQKFADAQFAKSIPTLSQAFTVLQTALILTINDLDHATGVMQLFSRAIIVVAQNIRSIAPFLVTITAAVVGVRVALAAYTATTTVASAATALFGRNIMLNAKEVNVARLAFAGWVTVLAIAVTAIHQFGQNIPVQIGQLQNLRQVLLFVEIAMKRVISTEQGFVITMGLLASAVLRFRGVVGQLPIALAILYDALRLLGVNAQTAAIAVGAIAIAFGVWQVATAELTAKLLEATAAALGFDAATAPMQIAIVLITAAFAAMVIFFPQIIQFFEDWKVKIEELINLIPGLNLLYEVLKKIVELAWPDMQKNIDEVKTKAEGVQETFLKWVRSLEETAKNLDTAKGETAGVADEAQKAADAYQAAADNAAKMAAAAKEAQGNQGGGGGQTTTINNSPNASNGSAIAIGNGNTQTINYTSGGGGSGSGGGGGSGSDSGGHGPYTSSLYVPDTVPLGVFNPSGGFQTASVPMNRPGPDHDQFVKYVQEGLDSYFKLQGGPAAGQTQFGPEATAQLQQIYTLMIQMSADGELSKEDLAAIKNQTGATNRSLQFVESTQKQYIKAAQDAAKAQIEAAQKAQEAAQKAQEQAAAQQEALQKLQQIQQAHDQSLTQALLTALNNTGLDFVSQLDPATQKIANQIADLNAALVQITNPVQAAEYQRRIQVLSDALDRNTKAVQDANDNPYLKYAQDVYGDATGIQGAKLTAQQAFATQVGSAAGAAAAQAIQQSGGGSGSGSGSHSSSNNNLGPGLSSRGSGLYLGAFAGGGEIDIGADGLYSASLHAGERVSIKQNSPGGGESKTVNVVLNINGVRDTIGFNRSRKQILTSMYKAIMGAGSTA